MILENEEVEIRINSAENLVNRLKAARGNKNENSSLNISSQDSLREQDSLHEQGNAQPYSATHPTFPAFPSRLPTSPTRKSELNVFGIPQDSTSTTNQFLPPSSVELIADAESKIKLGLTHGLATEVLYDSIEMLKNNLGNIDPGHPERLAKIAFEMGRIVTGINEARGVNNRNSSPTIIYKPVMVNEAHYEVLNVHE